LNLDKIFNALQVAAIIVPGDDASPDDWTPATPPFDLDDPDPNVDVGDEIPRLGVETCYRTDETKISKM
jgi:hypothetical protein